MKEIVSSVTRDMVGKSPHEILEHLARDRSFVPKKSMVIKAVEEMRKTAPLTFIVPTTVFTKDAPRKKVTEEKEIFEYKVKRHFMILSQADRKVLSEVLDEIFSLFVEEGDLVKFLGESRNISKNSLAILSTAIDHHFCAEYIASVHMFVPQVEELIRGLLTNRGKTPTKYAPTEEGVEEKLLGGLLQEVASYLDDDFAEYLNVLLTPSGENIRNKVCHGWMESEKFDRELSNTFIDVVLKLSIF
jgi:predicted house-cleaning noncanonical NTP pyrophosphatase (MazG superfamily)